MCLRCAADEIPQPEQYCKVCGCLIIIIDGAYYCTPNKCWCEEQPDVGDWHTLRDDSEPPPPIKDKKAWIDSVLDCFDE